MNGGHHRWAAVCRLNGVCFQLRPVRLFFCDSNQFAPETIPLKLKLIFNYRFANVSFLITYLWPAIYSLDNIQCMSYTFRSTASRVHTHRDLDRPDY